MNLIRYIILFLTLCNIASILIVGYGSPFLGALFSTLTYGLLMLYYFLVEKKNPAWPFILFAILYFTIAGVISVPSEKFYFRDFVKYVIIFVCGGEVARNTTIKDLYYFFVIGASSILVHAVFYADDFGRYSGFYLDPNSASFVCLMGCCATYSLKSEKWRLIGLFYLTFCGILTFSRSFFLLWLLMSMIGILQDKKNVKAIGLGLGTLLLLLSLSAVLQFNTSRLAMVEGLFSSEEIGAEDVAQDSRTETWSLYYDKIFESPVFGSGYGSFTGGDYIAGVHNSYLRILGESGIIPLLLYVGIYVFLFLLSLRTFKTKVYQTLLVLSIMTLLLTIHNFNTDDYITITSLWLYFQLTKKPDEEIDVFNNQFPLTKELNT